jgi:hypothetical protein
MDPRSVCFVCRTKQLITYSWTATTLNLCGALSTLLLESIYLPVYTMCDEWLLILHSKLKTRILVGAVAICWAFQLSRNDVVFDKCCMESYMHVIFRGTYWC